MPRALVVVLVLLAPLPAVAQPVLFGWKPPSGCTSNQVIQWNGSAWVCGTVNTFSTNNVIPKGNGTGLVSSSWTDDGTTTATTASLTSGDAAGDVFDHNGATAKFGSVDGHTYIQNNTVDFQWGSDSDNQTGYINYYGYNGGTTRDRNLVIADGKSATIATFTGSDKSLSVVGNLSTNGNVTLGDSSSDDTLFGGSTGYIWQSGDTLNYYATTAGTATGWINYFSELSAGTPQTTQFRNLIVGDGKGAAIATFTGSDKSLSVVGNLSTNANATLGDSTSDVTTVNGNFVPPLDTVSTTLDGTTQNNWAPSGWGTGTEMIDVTSATVSTTIITGLDATGMATGRRVVIRNRGLQYVALYPNNGGSSAANRFQTSALNIVMLATNSYVELEYLSGSGWLVVAHSSTAHTGMFIDGSVSIGSGGHTLDASSATTKVGDFRGLVLNVGSVSGTLNDWAPTGYATATHFAVTGTGSITLNGMAGGADGRIVVITNMAGSGVADITINHENASSSAANRFDLAVGGTWILATGESATFVYNGSSSRWVQVATRRVPELIVDGSLNGYTQVTQAADQDVTNAGVTDSNTLTISTAAGKIYAIDGFIIAGGNNTTGDYIFDFAVAAGTMDCTGTEQSVTTADAIQDTAVIATAAANTGSTSVGTRADASLPIAIRISLACKVSNTTTLKYRFGNASAASGRTSRTMAGSYLRWKQLN